MCNYCYIMALVQSKLEPRQRETLWEKDSKQTNLKTKLESDIPLEQIRACSIFSWPKPVMISLIIQLVSHHNELEYLRFRITMHTVSWNFCGQICY